MPRKIKNCFYEKLTFANLMSAHKRAKDHKATKNEVIFFEFNLENNITNLLKHIYNNTYKLGQYKSFKIYEPKERIIKSLPYVDRVVHQWYIEEFIKPYIVPRFIDTTFACLEGKGTHKAVETVQKYLQICKRTHNNFWILKCDIKKFFYNIDPNILFEIMKKYIDDKALLRFTKLLIFESRDSQEKVGIPIGNYTSQFFANIYLNELDQFVKRKLHIHFYVRYMDDFIILANSKLECIKIKQSISNFLNNALHLELNAKSKYYPYNFGVNFCGYRIFETHRLLRSNSKVKIKRNIKKWNTLYLNNQLSICTATQSLNSWIGHASHCNSYTLVNKMLSSCNFLYNDSFNEKIEKNLIYDIENYKA